MTATKIVSKKVYPVDELDRYTLFLRWACSTTADALTVQIRFWDITRTTSTDVTVYSSVATNANTWQIAAIGVVPPKDKRFLQIIVSKPNVATKFAIARIELKRLDTSLIRRANMVEIFEDFYGTTTNSIGQYPFVRGTIGSSPTVTNATPGNQFGPWSDTGVATLVTSAISGQGGTYGLLSIVYGPPPTGGEFIGKVLLNRDTNLTSWFGLFSSNSTIPDAALANTIYGIGLRTHNTGVAANWYGICRNGTAETSVDMGIVAGTNIATLGWIATSTGIQFTKNGRPYGAEVTTNIYGSTRLVSLVFGGVTRTTAALNVSCDFLGLQAFQTRYV